MLVGLARPPTPGLSGPVGAKWAGADRWAGPAGMPRVRPLHHNPRRARHVPQPTCAHLVPQVDLVTSVCAQMGSVHQVGKKWYGQVYHPLQRTDAGNQLYKYTDRVDTYDEARKLCDALYQKIKAEINAEVQKRKDADKTLDGLAKAPDNFADAVPRQAYWHASGNNHYIPTRIVRKSSGKQGFAWVSGCVACPINACSTARPTGPGATATHCVTHGGTCPHGKYWTACRECKVSPSSALCSVCQHTGLDTKRRVSNGGNGLCPSCEAYQRQQAAENGSTPPPKGKSWEDVFLDALLPLVTDPDGNVIAYEMRDDKSNMFGSNKQRRKGECSTTSQRRPDILWLKRDRDGYIVAAVMVEVDEDSHRTRKSHCEAGKIDDTFDSILKLAQEEGKGRLNVARTGTVRTPFVTFLRVNPNACDAPGSKIPLATRVRAVALVVRRILNAPYESLHKLADEGHTLMPHVQCFYYHTKEGGKHLAYYDAHAHGAWHWRGNLCPRDADMEGEWETVDQLEAKRSSFA